MARTSLTTLIFDALNQNAKADNDFMDVAAIGRAIFGNGYMAQTAQIFDKMIKERMYEVRELAEENGVIVIPRRKPTNVKYSGKMFRITGWKIATKEDEKYIQDELMFKAGRIAASKNAIVRLGDTARKRGILQESNLIGIAM